LLGHGEGLAERIAVQPAELLPRGGEHVTELLQVVRYLVPYRLGRGDHRGDGREGTPHVRYRRSQGDLGGTGPGQIATGKRRRGEVELDGRSVKQRTDLGKLPVGGTPQARHQLGGPVHHRRVGIERLPQGGQVRGGGVPALAGPAGQRRPGEQPLAEAVVEFQQVGLDGVALVDRGRDRGG